MPGPVFKPGSPALCTGTLPPEPLGQSPGPSWNIFSYSFPIVLSWTSLLVPSVFKSKHLGITFLKLEFLILVHIPVVQKSFKLVWRCHQLRSRFLAKGHLPRVSRQSLRWLMIRVIMKWPVHRSGICLTGEENLS